MSLRRGSNNYGHRLSPPLWMRSRCGATHCLVLGVQPPRPRTLAPPPPPPPRASGRTRGGGFIPMGRKPNGLWHVVTGKGQLQAPMLATVWASPPPPWGRGAVQGWWTARGQPPPPCARQHVGGFVHLPLASGALRRTGRGIHGGAQRQVQGSPPSSPQPTFFQGTHGRYSGSQAGLGLGQPNLLPPTDSRGDSQDQA